VELGCWPKHTDFCALIPADDGIVVQIDPEQEPIGSVPSWTAFLRFRGHRVRNLIWAEVLDQPSISTVNQNTIETVGSPGAAPEGPVIQKAENFL